ncbi:hypothetical protein HYQ45_017788 [Verticillium longisporum]|uniref:Uncharacterized protein n=1 Tax=Verticillium longisporum TaxID=100787 RepID=A0A8I3AGZ0_VERLO|nr:hypothetical protein HYQ45_017788 [Verticillium longisporum]
MQTVIQDVPTSSDPMDHFVESRKRGDARLAKSLRLEAGKTTEVETNIFVGPRSSILSKRRRSTSLGSTC